jgi:acetyl-CoA carboxylase biotin carboxyl carrier protein
MDLRKLKTLIDLVAESNIAELEITEGDGKVRIVKAGVAQQTSALAAAGVPPLTGNMAAPAGSQASPHSHGANLGQDATGLGQARGPNGQGAGMAGASLAQASEQLVLSPMVGTFYRASSPGAAPYASVGDTVTEGQTLCVIEAMKLMNEIPADRAGVIQAVLVENGQPVEFGQPLFEIA